MQFNLSAYRKTVTALVVGTLGWATLVVTSPESAISASEWLVLGVNLATGLGVYTVPNTSK